MKKFSLLFIIAGSYLTATAQPGKTNASIVQKIKEEETSHSQLAMIAHNLTDVCGPRLTNSPGYKKAVAWVSSKFAEWQLQHAGPEAWGEFGQGWSNERTVLSLQQPYYQPMIACPSAWTKGTAQPLTAAVLLVDNIDSATIDKLGDAIKGKIIIRKPVMRTLPSPFNFAIPRLADSTLSTLPDDYMVSKEEIASIIPQVKKAYMSRLYLEQKGAVGLLISGSGTRDELLIGQGGPAYQKQYAPSLPELFIGREDYLRITRLLEDKIDVKLSMDVQNSFYSDDLTGYNVVGEIAGTDPKLKDQVVMLGGHLDSWHPSTGATDNAAGCAVMMEAIRLLKALDIKPRRTIRIALWGGEEQGPYGSFGYVKNHYGNPIDMKLKPEQKNVSAYFNLDNGTGKIRGIYAQHNEKVVPIFKEWLLPFADSGATGITMSNTGSTDHLSFDAVGIPAFQFIQDPLEYETRTHHTNIDSYEHLYMDDLRQAAMIVAYFVYNTAMRDEMLPRKPLPKPERFVFDVDFPF